MKLPTKKVTGGFSLVELLVVIAVIAIIAAIAIPNIANITGAAGESAAQRNAQNLASVYSAAVAAGVPRDDLGNTLDAIIGNLTSDTGVTAQVGNQEVGPFRVDGYPADDTLIRSYIDFTAGDGTGYATLRYRATASTE